MTHLPTENEKYAGFYNIQGYPDYVITPYGAVMNVKRNVLLKGCFNPNGYFNYRLTAPTGESHTWGRHRLMAFVFKHPGVDVADLVVNHKNGIKGDDWLDNLEWTTYQGNLEHAGENGLTEKCRPILVRDAILATVTHYPSMVEAARDLRMTKDAIGYRISVGPDRLFPERKQYKFADDVRDWKIFDDVEEELLKNGRAKKVVARGVLSGTTRVFESIDLFCKEFGFSPPSVSVWLSRKNQPVLPGLIQVKALLDKTPWREVSDPYLELEETTGQKVVIVKKPQSEEVRIFESAVSCARAMGVLPTTLNERLKSAGTKVYSDGYTYAYYCA